MTRFLKRLDTLGDSALEAMNRHMGALFLISMVVICIPALILVIGLFAWAISSALGWLLS